MSIVVAGRFQTIFYSQFKVDGLVKSPNAVMPANAGIQKKLKTLDFRIRGNDAKRRI